MGAAVAKDGAQRQRTYRGASPEQRQFERRDRLLGSALELYGTVGFANVSIQALCRHSGVTARHFYEAFDSRDQVLEELHDRIVGEAAALVVGALDGVEPTDPTAMSRAGLHAFYTSMLGDPRRARIAMIEVMGLPAEKALACVDQFGAIIEAYAVQLEAAGLVRLPSVHLTAVILAGAVRQLMVDWLTARDRAPVEELVEVTTDLFATVGRFAAP
ncbi:MAG: TetR family transcriptional regulator [Acidimicrobiales bacterium]|nr:TetR family transcriptional regulator [Acidimicrobiales bacterium]